MNRKKMEDKRQIFNWRKNEFESEELNKIAQLALYKINYLELIFIKIQFVMKKHVNKLIVQAILHEN